MDRREFLQLSGGLLTGALLPATAEGRRWEEGSIGKRKPALVEYVGRPHNLGTPMSAFTKLITPTEHFFVRSHFGPPALRRNRRLHVHGMVERPLTLTPEDLAPFEPAEFTGVLQCAGSGRAFHEPRVPGVQWEHGGMGQGIWKGVRLADLLRKAGVKAGATHVVLLGADLPPQPTVPAFVRSLPLEKALDPGTLVATMLNGEPLGLLHGAPMRLVVPGWAGDHWMKWLVEVKVTAAEAEGFYMQSAYRLPKRQVAPGTAVKPANTESLTVIPVKSVIGFPREGQTLKPGPHGVVGVAFSGVAPISRVEVSTDGGGSWRPAELTGEAAPGRWQVFRYPIESPLGEARAMSRATDASGRTQPLQPIWNPGGYFWNGRHEVRWLVVADP